MMKKTGALILNNWFLYLAGFLLLFWMKYSYSRATVDDLKWILSPTARWVRILSSIPFEYESRVGFVNHDYHFIIASSCSGVQFMMITTATLYFSFVHRMKSRFKGLGWLLLSYLGAYLYTVFVNGIRIVVSILLPLFFNQYHPAFLQVPPERLHTMIGIIIYFTALLIIYYAFGSIWSKKVPQLAVPMFWYLLISLAIPFLNRAYRHQPANFSGYAVMIITTSVIMICLFHLLRSAKNRLQILLNDKTQIK